jgi:hypothetical protein
MKRPIDFFKRLNEKNLQYDYNVNINNYHDIDLTHTIQIERRVITRRNSYETDLFERRCK